MNLLDSRHISCSSEILRSSPRTVSSPSPAEDSPPRGTVRGQDSRLRGPQRAGEVVRGPAAGAGGLDRRGGRAGGRRRGAGPEEGAADVHQGRGPDPPGEVPEL